MLGMMKKYRRRVSKLVVIKRIVTNRNNYAKFYAKNCMIEEDGFIIITNL